MQKLLTLMMLSIFALTACAGAGSTATLMPAQGETNLAPPPSSEGPGATATELPLTGPRATAAALAGQVTLNAPTRGPESDDYPGMVRHAWQLIFENYYSDEFNGVDWEAVRDEYVARAEQVNSQQEFWALMEEFVGRLGDQHSNFSTPAEVSSRYGTLASTGSPWSGIHMWPPPGRVPDVLRLWKVCNGGPAAAAGLMTGDHVLAINGEQVVLDEKADPSELVVRVMFGDGESNSLTLRVLQGEGQQPREVTFRLGGAPGCDGWESEIIVESPRVGYIRVPSFGLGADTVLLDTIEELETSGELDGLILDIRHNPGGLDNVVSNAIGFFTEGQFGTLGPLREGRTRTIFSVRGPVEWSSTIPLAVITDPSSHSAADYFAVAMKVSGRATLIGMPTAGNTEAWTNFSMPDGSVIGIAISILELPDGSTIEGVGVQPDVRVPLGDWGLKQEPDIQLERAIELMVDAASD